MENYVVSLPPRWTVNEMRIQKHEIRSIIYKTNLAAREEAASARVRQRKATYAKVMYSNNTLFSVLQSSATAHHTQSAPVSNWTTAEQPKHFNRGSANQPPAVHRDQCNWWLASGLVSSWKPHNKKKQSSLLHAYLQLHYNYSWFVSLFVFSGIW